MVELSERDKKRLAELEAAAPKRRKKTKLFAAMPLATAAKAFTAMNCPKAALPHHCAADCRPFAKLAPLSLLRRHRLGRPNWGKPMRKGTSHSHPSAPISRDIVLPPPWWLPNWHRSVPIPAGRFR